MSKWRKGHGERDGRIGDPGSWRDEPWTGPRLVYDADRRSSSSDGKDRISETREESWIFGLLRLVERKGAWVGTEEQLLEELKAPAVEGVYRSGDFPPTLDEVHDYIASAHSAFDELDLELLDYRELSGEPLEYWRQDVIYLPGASGWGPQNPMLVCRRSRVPTVEYYWALGRILKHWDPFPLSLLLFAEGDDGFDSAGRWVGTSFVLVRVLRMYYPTFDNVPYEIVSLADLPAARGCLPDYENVREYGRLFELLPTDDYSPFNERMLASIPILREVGIRVRRMDPSEDRGGGEHTDSSRTEWFIEAPRWDNPELF